MLRLETWCCIAGRRRRGWWWTQNWNRLKNKICNKSYFLPKIKRTEERARKWRKNKNKNKNWDVVEWNWRKFMNEGIIYLKITNYFRITSLIVSKRCLLFCSHSCTYTFFILRGSFRCWMNVLCCRVASLRSYVVLFLTKYCCRLVHSVNILLIDY